MESNNSETSHSPNKHTYRLLGESGLVEDEEGNLYNADLSDLYSLPKEPLPEPLWQPETSGKTPPSYWDYDPRYCGPDPDAYLEERWKQYQAKASHNSDGAQSSVKETPADAAQDSPQEDCQPRGGLHLPIRTIVFLIIGAIVFIGYFILLIISLMEQLSRLF